MNCAEGAFVFLTPSARQVYAAKQPHVPVACEWTVPLKAGNEGIKTWVASPFPHDGGPLDEVHQVGELILKTFDRTEPSRSDVVTKRDNTRKFLEHALMQWRRFKNIQRGNDS